MSTSVILILVVIYFAFGADIINSYINENPQAPNRLSYLIAITLWPLISLLIIIFYIFYIFGEEK